jgi:hypothetical protein
VDRSQRLQHVEETIRSSLDEGIAVFWPEQFVEAGLGNLEEILEALGRLAQDEKLEAVVIVRCSNGHLCWQGTSEEFRGVDVFRCSEDGCEDEELQGEELEGHAFVFFRLTTRWGQVVREKKSHAMSHL